MSKEKNISQYDKMTQTPIKSLLLKLSIPTVITMLITSAYNMADTAFVGRLGTSASGAVGVVFGFMSVLQAIGFFYGQGCGSILSRELGAKRKDLASQTASTGFFLSLFTSTLVAVLCGIFIGPLIKVLGSTETIAPYAKTYIGFILVAAPFIVPSFTLNNILRYEGKAALGAVAMMTGAILNIIGDPIFMFVFDMGIAGAGLSTALAQVVSFSILLSMFLRKKTQTKLSIKLFSLDFSKILNICGTGLPSLLRQCLGGLSVVVLNFLAKPYGDAAIAAMSIVSRISFFVFSIGLGIGQGFQPISGFNYGAKKYKRVREAYYTTMVVAEVLITLLSIVALCFSSDLIRIFRDDALVIEIGTRALRLHLGTMIFLPYCMISEMFLQTTGKKAAASFLSSARSGLLFIPILFVLAWLRGLAGIQEAQPVAYIVSIIPTYILTSKFLKELPKEDQEKEA
ncbi:MAG: MATE family efflux transporter [Lachnospiraceae bacterium]|nr:MATE family efflux transporter [Lachnospiraceae bacterium]